MKKYFVILVFFLTSTWHLYRQDVVATTSILASVIKDIAGEKLEVVTLVPAGSCPGHFDLKVTHLTSIKKSALVFAHGFEEYLDKIMLSMGESRCRPFIIKTEGSWFLPDIQISVYERIGNILSVRFPEYKDYFEKNKGKVESEIVRSGIAVKKMIAEKKLAGSPVICNEHIKEMLEYMGFKVVGTYGRKEDLTVSDIKTIIREANKKNVILVVDNLQAGPDTGLVIAEQLKISHVAISNFPGVLPKAPTLRQTLYENAKRIIYVYGTKNKTY